MSMRTLSMVVAAALLAGCGLAEVGAGAATNGAAAAEQVEAGKKQMQQMQQDIEAANKVAADARAAAEAVAQ